MKELSSNNWTTLSKFPNISGVYLSHLYANAYSYESHDFVKRLDQCMHNHLFTRPKLILQLPISPATLDQFKLTAISSLMIDALTANHPIESYLDVLESNKQRPIHIFQMGQTMCHHPHTLTLQVKRRLFEFPVPELSTRSLKLSGDELQFAKIIAAKHAKEPFLNISNQQGAVQ